MKTEKQKKDSELFTLMGWIGIILTCMVLFILTSCTGTYYIADTKYERTSVIYYDNQIYSGWSNGYYYYYGMPHYYPWNYYYNTCPPSHYTHTTHIVINNPVNRPTHRPNRPNRPNRNIIVKPNRNTYTNTTIKVKPNRTNNKIIVKPNRNTTKRIKKKKN